MTSRASSNFSAFRPTDRRGGFSLVEVLLACALLALALVPLMRATSANRRSAEALRSLTRQTLEEGDASARQAAEAAAKKALAPNH